MAKHVTPAHVFASVPQQCAPPITILCNVEITSDERPTATELKQTVEAAIAVLNVRGLKRTANNLMDTVMDVRPDWTVTIIDEKLDVHAGSTE